MSQPASDTAQNHLSQDVESYRDGGKQERKEEETGPFLESGYILKKEMWFGTEEVLISRVINRLEL